MNTHKGFSLAELVITLAIVTAIGWGVTTLGRDIFLFNNIAQANLNAQVEGRRAVRFFSAELREASPSSLGAYPIAAAATSTITFFTDYDNDGIKEQIRYYLQNKNLMKGVIKPTGNPLTYNAANETLSTVVTDIANGTSTPVFLYYDSTYAGTTTPLTLPINLTAVRLVQIQLVVDRNPNRSPNPLTVTSAITLRNLKDNL